MGLDPARYILKNTFGYLICYFLGTYGGNKALLVIFQNAAVQLGFFWWSEIVIAIFNEGPGSINWLIKRVGTLFLKIGGGGSSFEGDLCLHSSRAQMPPQPAQPSSRRAATTAWSPDRPTAMARVEVVLNTMATFTLILWSHVVHFDAIFSVNVDAKLSYMG